MPGIHTRLNGGMLWLNQRVDQLDVHSGPGPARRRFDARPVPRATPGRVQRANAYAPLTRRKTMQSYEVARYLAIDAVDSPTFTPNGRLLFRADTTGTPQVWTVDTVGGWPERLTPHEERISTVEAAPDREAFVFGMDEGSNERDQLFLYDLDTGREYTLTDVADAKHAWGAWGPHTKQVAYTANRREADRFDVFIQQVREGGKNGPNDPDTDRGWEVRTPKLVHEGPGGRLNVAAFGPAGRRIALLEPRASYDVELSVLDLETKTAKPLASGEQARYSDVHFGPGGEVLYCVTDHGADTAYVARIDLKSGGVEPVAGYDEGPGGPGTDAWEVDNLALDRETGHVVFTRNVDGYAELHGGRIDDTEFISETVPEVTGVVSDLTFGPEGLRYALTLTASDQPYGVYTAEFGAGTMTEWSPVGTCGIPASSFRTPETVRYESFDGRAIPAYWTRPGGESDGKEVPVIVDIHGGPEHQRRPWFYPTKQYFLNRGYAVLEPNVRGSSGYGDAYSHLDDVENRMDSVRDIKHAVEWLRGQPGVNADRAVAYGRSYGGFMVLAAITEYPELWAAAVEFVGIADFTTFLENTGEWRRSHREAEYGSLEDDYELLKELSPLSRIDRIACPLFVQHGANDPRVPVSEAEQVVETVKRQGVPVESLIFENEGHHTTSRGNKIEEFQRIASFLDEHV